MKALLMVGAASSFASAASAQSPMAEADVSLGKVSNQYICRFGAAVSPGALGSEAAKAAGGMGQVLYTYRHAMLGFTVRMPAQVGVRSHIAELRARNPKIAGCEQDQYVRALGQPGATARPGGGGGSTAQIVDWGVTRIGGAGSPASGRTAWVIDSGIDLDHPDLNTTDARHMSFLERDSNPDDLNGHGTHVAGIIAARDNSVGSVGVAPGAPVVAVRVLDRRGSGTWSGVIAGIDYVGERAASGDVANMSLGGGASDIVDDAVKCAADGPSASFKSPGYICPSTRLGGISFTIAAGNDSADADSYSPARANGKNIYTVSSFTKGVSATDDIDPWSAFSNYGPSVDFAEPGSNIYSSYKDGTYKTLSGTSMAAPHLAGILMAGSVRTDTTVDGDPHPSPSDAIGER